jgi:hypothetical protein
MQSVTKVLELVLTPDAKKAESVKSCPARKMMFHKNISGLGEQVRFRCVRKPVERVLIRFVRGFPLCIKKDAHWFCFAVLSSWGSAHYFHSAQSEPKGQRLILFIDRDSYTTIQRTGHRIFTGLSQGTVKVLKDPEAQHVMPDTASSKSVSEGERDDLPTPSDDRCRAD